jgi:hypothetical protein
MSTSTFAAGCTMSSSLSTVAPSFEIVVALPVVIILSIPRGPRVVRITSTTDWQALMLLMIWERP